MIQIWYNMIQIWCNMTEMLNHMERSYMSVSSKVLWKGCIVTLLNLQIKNNRFDHFSLYLHLYLFLYLYLYLYLYCQLLNQPPVLPHVTLLPQVDISLLLFYKTRYIPKFSNSAEFFWQLFLLNMTVFTVYCLGSVEKQQHYTIMSIKDFV